MENGAPPRTSNWPIILKSAGGILAVLAVVSIFSFRALGPSGGNILLAEILFWFIFPGSLISVIIITIGFLISGPKSIERENTQGHTISTSLGWVGLVIGLLVFGLFLWFMIGLSIHGGAW